MRQYLPRHTCPRQTLRPPLGRSTQSVDAVYCTQPSSTQMIGTTLRRVANEGVRLVTPETGFAHHQSKSMCSGGLKRTNSWVEDDCLPFAPTLTMCQARTLNNPSGALGSPCHTRKTSFTQTQLRKMINETKIYIRPHNHIVCERPCFIALHAPP